MLDAARTVAKRCADLIDFDRVSGGGDDVQNLDHDGGSLAEVPRSVGDRHSDVQLTAVVQAMAGQMARVAE